MIEASIATPSVLPGGFRVVEGDRRTGRRGNSNTGRQLCDASSYSDSDGLIISYIPGVASVENGISDAGNNLNLCFHFECRGLTTTLPDRLLCNGEEEGSVPGKRSRLAGLYS
jgi:hypothetical protein